MAKNLPLEFTKIQDFVMEDDTFQNVDEWYNHVIKDLKDVAYRRTDGKLRTDLPQKTNIRLNSAKREGLLEDLQFRFNQEGETNRLRDIERRLIGKYRINIVDEDTKLLRQEVLEKFLKYFNESEITNKYDPEKKDIEDSDTGEVELSFDDAIRRGLIIASITSNKKLAMGQMMATLMKYPVKNIDKKEFAQAAGRNIPEFISFSQDMSIEDLKELLANEFPNFQFTEAGGNGDEEYEIEYFFPIGDYFPTLVYYENKTLKTEGEILLRNLIRKFKVKSNKDLMEIHTWMTAHQPEGPEYPTSAAGSYVLVISNRPSSQIRLTTGTPWATAGSCASITGSAGGNRADGRPGHVSGWTGFTDVRNMNLIGFLFANTEGPDKSSNLEDINADWPLVWDDTLKGRVVMRWGYVSDEKNSDEQGRPLPDYNFRVEWETYDNTQRIGFSVEPYYGMESNEYRKPLTTAIYEVLNSVELSEKYWNSLASPHPHIGATDRSRPPAARSGGLGSYGRQIYTTKQKTINGVYYLDEGVDILDEQKSIAMSDTLSIGQAMAFAKRRTPVEVRLLLAQNERIWLFPNAVKELFALKDFDTNMILLSSPLCTKKQILEFFNHLDFYTEEEQLQLINNIVNNTSFDNIVEQRLINYLEVNHTVFKPLFNTSRTYKSLNDNLKLSYSLFLILKGLIFNQNQGREQEGGIGEGMDQILYLPYSRNIVDKLIDVLFTLSNKEHMKIKERKIKTGRETIINDYYELSRVLLFAKQTSASDYIRIIEILKRTIPVADEMGLSWIALNSIVLSYVVNYNLMDNNKVRDYYLKLYSSIISDTGVVLSQEVRKMPTTNFVRDSLPTYENYMLNNRNNLPHFRNRQTDSPNIGSLETVNSYIDELNEGENSHSLSLKLSLLLNSKPDTTSQFTNLADIGRVLGKSNLFPQDRISQDDIKLLKKYRPPVKGKITLEGDSTGNEIILALLSNTINFENENYVGNKLIRNPVNRIALFNALNDREAYVSLFTPEIRELISLSLNDLDINFSKGELESYIVDEIIQEKLYDFHPLSDLSLRNIPTIKLTNYLINSEQIELLFRELLQYCFGAFYSEETYIMRNPLPLEAINDAERDGDIELFIELSDTLNNIKDSDEWIDIDYRGLANNLNSLLGGEYFGFCNNNKLPDELQYFILTTLEEIGREYEIYRYDRLFKRDQMAVRLSQNRNLSQESIEVLMGVKSNLTDEIKRNLAMNENTPIKYLITENKDNKKALLEKYPYEVLLNTQIEEEQFYELYNYIYRILLSRVDSNVFNMNQFIIHNLQPLIGIDKGVELRKTAEDAFWNFRKDIFYWRGGFNLAKKFGKIEDINYWLMEGGEGGIADYPIMPSKDYQRFSIVKWDADKTHRKIINIHDHKSINEKLVFIEGVETYFDGEGHLQNEPIADNVSIDKLFGYVPEDERKEVGEIFYCKTCLDRTTASGKPVKPRFQNQGEVDLHLQKKAHEDVEEVEILKEPAKVKKWTHECIFVTIDRNTYQTDLRIPDWRYGLTHSTFTDLLNTIGIRMGGLAMFDRIYKNLPIECETGEVTLRYQVEDMIKNINQVHAWSVDFIDDNLDLLCNLMQNHYQTVDMWSNFIFTDSFIEHAMGFYTQDNENYANLIIYLLYNIELNRIGYSELENLVLNIQDVETLLLLNRFLSEVKF